MHLQVSLAHTRFVCPDEEQASVREGFDRTHHLSLPSFFDARLMADVRSRLAEGTSAELAHEVGHEITVTAERASALLDFVVNDDVLFDAVDRLTGCGPIGCFQGRVYEMRSGHHEFTWHTDLIEDRLIAMSVNLGDAYEGGLLQLAEAASKAILQTIANLGSGDAVIFRLAPTLAHRVTPVTGSAPKIAYAGWFRARPSYRSLLGSWSRTAAILKGAPAPS